MPSSTALVSLKDAALNVGPTSYLLPLEKLVPENDVDRVVVVFVRLEPTSGEILQKASTKPLKHTLEK